MVDTRGKPGCVLRPRRSRFEVSRGDSARETSEPGGRACASPAPSRWSPSLLGDGVACLEEVIIVVKL